MSLNIKTLFNEIIENIPTTATVAVLGRMRSGKTTFSKLFADHIEDYYKAQGYSVFYFVFTPSIIDNISTLTRYIEENSQDVNILIFDDLSFKLSGNTRQAREFFNMITRIAHITLSDFNYIFFIGHYSRAISPFLRASNVVVLTSITHPEIAGLKELFTLSSLYDFLYYHEIYPRRYIFLIRYHVFERIIDFTIESLAKPLTKRQKLNLDTKMETSGFR
jgi:hypothetical protein